MSDLNEKSLGSIGAASELSSPKELAAAYAFSQSDLQKMLTACPGQHWLGVAALPSQALAALLPG